MLDDRKAEILRAVVAEYIETAQPVGSSRVVDAASLDVSAATVRNELATLEREGYLIQPHTSAGRVPTQKGYRYFVDSLAPPGVLGLAERHAVSEFFRRTHGALEQVLHDTSGLLADLTRYAAVVVGPSHEVATIRSAQLVLLHGQTVLLVVVLSNGAVEKRAFEVDADDSDERVMAASAHLGRHLTGTSMGADRHVPPSGDPDTDRIVKTAMSTLSDEEPEADNVFVGGASQMAGAFEAVDTVRAVLSILEQQYLVVTLLRDVLDRGLSVAIGSEVGHEALAECSVIVSPYVVDGEEAGTIGIVGPTRMKYPRAQAAVALVSQRLSKQLSEST